jgi:hypothetical protein
VFRPVLGPLAWLRIDHFVVSMVVLVVLTPVIG